MHQIPHNFLWGYCPFRPLSFRQNLFGMHVNVLEGNPDWRWYILFAAFCTVLRGALWKVFHPFVGILRSLILPINWFY